jgi:hypothetical protein
MSPFSHHDMDEYARRARAELLVEFRGGPCDGERLSLADPLPLQVLIPVAERPGDVAVWTPLEVPRPERLRAWRYVLRIGVDGPYYTDAGEEVAA